MSKYRLDIFARRVCAYRVIVHIIVGMLIWLNLPHDLRQSVVLYYLLIPSITAYAIWCSYALHFSAPTHSVINVDEEGFCSLNSAPPLIICQRSRVTRFFIYLVLQRPLDKQTKNYCFFASEMSEVDFRRLARIIKLSGLRNRKGMS